MIQTMSNQSLTCQKHNKIMEIFVVNEGKYICEDCAIFQPIYRNQILMEKQTVTIKAQQIDQQCMQLGLMQESNKETTHKNLCLLFKQIDHLESTLIEDIRKQFKQVRAKVQSHYLEHVQTKEWQRNKHGRSVICEIKKETVPQKKIKKQKQYHSDIELYKNYLSKQLAKINTVFENIQLNLSKCEVIKIVNVAQQFNKIFQKKTLIQNQFNEDLLDFSEFSIIQQQSQTQSADMTFCQPILIQDPNIHFFKRHHVERMKTAPCLEDSLCSIDSFPKSIESKLLNIPITQSKNLAESILSERSITCSSVASKTLTSSTMMTKEPSKKFTIEVTSLEQLQKKLLSISPTIKIVRLKNIPLSSQDFSSLLKQKISKSFIHTLEIINCPKLSDKILMDLKSYRCKSLKKIEIKECREINWADKRVKDLVRKLETEGVRIVC